MKTWTDEMLALLGTESDNALGDRWDMSRMTVARKRQSLAIASYDLKRGGFQRETLFRWSPENLALIGQESGATVARRLGISRRAVYLMRLRQGLAPAKRAPRVYTLPPEAVPLLGKVRDAELAHRFGIPDDLVYRERKRREIPKLQVEQPLSEALLADLGTDSDRAIGLRHGVHYSKVRQLRLKRQIPAYKRPNRKKITADGCFTGGGQGS